MEIITRQAAIAAGLKYYYTGKPCKHGHVVERYLSNSGCSECKRMEAERRKNATPLYGTWNMMKQRCYNENCIGYEDYGALGITVCDRWLDPERGYENFVADMGPRPDGFSIDRIDFDGNYEPTNCRWANPTTQNRNKRNSKLKGEDIFRVRGLLSEGLSQRQIARMYSCAQTTISYCVTKHAY